MNDENIKIAIDTTYMDRRPGMGTAIVIRHTVEELRRYKDRFDITLVHRMAIPEDPIYKEFKEIVIPQMWLPRFSGFFSELRFFLTTRQRFDVYYFSYSRIYPIFWLAPARKIIYAAMDGGPKTAGYKTNAKGKVSFWAWLFFRRIDAFIAITEFGKNGIASAYNVPLKKIHVVYNGVRQIFEPIEDLHSARALIQEKYGITSPYLLCVSRFDPHKNILNLVRAYKELVDVDASLGRLVFVGGRHMPEYSDQVDRLIKELGMSERIYVAPFINEVDLPAVYNAADMLVFPSFYEGFGLPVIEALSCGLPVVASDIEAVREITGGLAVLVDPYKIESIRDGISRIHRNHSQRAVMKSEGPAWARRFTWKAHGDAFAQIVADIAARN